MIDYFAANDLAAFSIISGTPTEVTTAGRFDSTYTTKAIDVTPAGAIAHSADFQDPTTGASVSLTDFWVHYESIQQSTVSTVAFYNSAGVEVLRISNPTANTRRIDFWNGASFTVGTGGAISTLPGDGNRHIVDIHIITGAAGSVNLYIDGTLAATQSGLNAAVTNVRSVRLNGGNTGVASFSQFLVSDTNTIGAKVASLVPNSNSATNTAWSNDFTNLVKNGYNDATLVSSATLSAKEGYGATDVTLPTSQYFVSSMFFAVRGRLNTVSPANVKPMLRIGGTDYNGAYNFPGLSSVSFGPSLAAFPTDPSTGAAWSGVTNLNAAELGFIAQT